MTDFSVKKNLPLSFELSFVGGTKVGLLSTRDIHNNHDTPKNIPDDTTVSSLYFIMLFLFTRHDGVTSRQGFSEKEFGSFIDR